MNKHENANHKKLNGEVVQQYRLFYGNQGKESFTQDGSHLYKTASITPTVSLTSSDSCVSSSSDISIDANSVGRYNQEEGSSDGSQEDLNFISSGSLQNLGSSIYANGIHRLTTEEFNREILGTGVGQRLRDNVLDKTGLSIDDETGTSHSCHEDMNTQFWLPPDPEDQGDDIVGSVCNYDYDDDDDECGDGIKWGRTSSLNSLGEEGSGSSRFKLEKQKAIDDVMNGKFKTLVGQLLKSVDVSLSREDGDSWVDIVTSLSWEAASFVKPDVTESKVMDPDGYIKIKCVATGTRSQSQLVKGLVFKKHAALKRMSTAYEKPRLLLIRGELGVSSSGLSSFELVQQENDSLQSVIEMIGMCHPNVVLVEKSVSRDIQESILAKGMTLISDMKSHRLERIARCTGSQILSSDMLNGQKLRRCDSFRIEKFEEEHTPLGEGGKKPRKTLMFLEGCPTRMGCTILLMGTHTDELKRIKCVVHCAVVMAYHLILETSFILDQRAMFSILPLNGVTNISLTGQETPLVVSHTLNDSYEKSHPETNSSGEISTPISNRFHEEGSIYPNLALKNDSPLSYEPYNPIVFSGLSCISASLKKVIGNSFPLFSSTSRQSMSTYFGLLDGMDDNDKIQASGQVSSSLEAFDHSATETTEGYHQDKKFNCGQSHSSSNPYNDNPNVKKNSGNDQEQRQSKDDISTVLHSESILVLMSSRNASKGTICEHCRFSRIKFYRNFDVPLGKFLLDNLLNQRLQCNTCGEAPEAHFYYYAHHNKQLTIQLKSLPNEKHLPGESEGKLWMWSCCGKCRPCDENSKSTKRVLISTAARGLSFGKFLELSFSDQSSFCKSSRCGHSFNKDFLYFFGYGPMVAMFRYSLVSTYSVFLPPQKLENSSSIKGEFLEKDLKNVYMKGTVMFEDIAKALKKIESRFMGSTLSLEGSIKELSDIENMLTKERHKFEVDTHNTIISAKVDNAAYKFLSLNRLQWELLLESCVWDRRLHFLLSPDTTVCKVLNSEKPMKESTCPKVDGNTGGTDVAEIIVSGGMNNMSEASVEADDFLVREIPVEGSLHVSGEGHKALPFPDMSEDIPWSMPERIVENESSPEDITMEPEFSDASNAIDEKCQSDPLHSVSQSQTGSVQPVSGDLGSGDIDLDVPQSGKSQISFSLSNLENCKEWIWTSFPEIQFEYMKDLRKGYIPNFECICPYTVDTMVHKVITEEGSRLYIPVGTTDYIVSDYDDEFSSLIACSLVLLKDVSVTTESLDEVAKKGKGMDNKTYEPSHSFSRLPSLSSSYWSSIGSQDSDGVHLPHSISAEELHLSSFDGLNLLDPLVSSGTVHPEVFLGFGRSSGKGKYSVVCLYANLFRDLRSRCCSSELDYIASLSRCRNWDAKGGKSKSFFAKTLDDRFIVKEIKRSEFDSFGKFAPEYFRYMNQCFDIGNQTCLAKILGIYQIRLTKSGKEIKHDLMVMENLSFGRNITRQYDLKGALHSRFNSAADGPGDVLLDQNFVNDMNASPLYLSRKGMRNLQRAVWNDTTFLNSINVMDYSLLVGVDTQQRELVCGIIDYLRQYTWDKQLENWVKSSLVVPKNQLPTVISPKEYKKRFRKFIHEHFLSVPENWCSERASNPCKLCGSGDYGEFFHERYGEHDEHPSHTKSEGQEE